MDNFREKAKVDLDLAKLSSWPGGRVTAMEALDQT
jgi:hypothetical protein